MTKTAVFRFLVTPGERRTLNAGARAARAPSTSEWVRSLALRQAAKLRGKVRIELPRETAAALVAQRRQLFPRQAVGAGALGDQETT